MPTYDYICQACGHALEIFQSMSESPKRKCPECGKLKLQRQIGMGAGILFKGSGFYETDYRSDSYSKGEKAASEAKKSGDEKKSDKAKPKETGKSKKKKPS
jgi:putative FmdB family regulatory protein